LSQVASITRNQIKTFKKNGIGTRRELATTQETHVQSVNPLVFARLNEQALDPDVIEAALAHQDKNSVRSAYNRAEYLARRRVLMQWWSDHIESAVVDEYKVGKKQLKVAI
jgi:integrase